jgi:hypothetical protein
MPAKLSFGAMGLRTGAIIIDHGLVVPLLLILTFVVIWLVIIISGTGDWNPWLQLTVPECGFIAYFAVAEWLWGATPGKLLLRLRVRRCATDYHAAGFFRILWRSILYAAISKNVSLLTVAEGLMTDGGSPGATHSTLYAALEVASVPLAILMFLSTMRASNGYRGPHELLSGTCVIRLPWPQRKEAFVSPNPDRLTERLSPADDLAQALGPFKIRGVVHQGAGENWLLGEDAVLGRKVLIYDRPLAQGPLPAARRNLHRPTRLRWLGGGQQGSRCWDAFLAPVGCPLADLCAPTKHLSWRAFRGILVQLTDELDAAAVDETLPSILNVDQVWVHPNGSVQVLDMAVQSAVAPSIAPAENTDPQRALRLLGEMAQLALEGRLRDGGDAPGPVKAPVPEHAKVVLQRLACGPNAYQSVGQLKADLGASHDRLAEVTRRVRAAKLLLLGLGLVPLLVVLLAITAFMAAKESPWRPADHLFGVRILVLYFVFLLQISWVLMTRGGLTLPMMGLTLVRSDGSRASAWRCAWRGCVMWLPLYVLLTVPIIVSIVMEESSAGIIAWGMAWVLVAVYLVGSVIVALLFPNRSLHDWLAGTYLVPK